MLNLRKERFIINIVFKRSFQMALMSERNLVYNSILIVLTYYYHYSYSCPSYYYCYYYYCYNFCYFYYYHYHYYLIVIIVIIIIVFISVINVIPFILFHLIFYCSYYYDLCFRVCMTCMCPLVIFISC